MWEKKRRDGRLRCGAIADEDCEALFIMSNVFAIIIIADLTERIQMTWLFHLPILDVGFGIASSPARPGLNFSMLVATTVRQ
eukprot:scaffold9686_cov170-Skeletonema_menzelii.AAC.4